jgi:polyisoprenoid-binding protein YceI
MKNAFQIAFLSAALVAGPVFASTWNIDPSHSSATFAVKHMGFSNVRGEFGKLEGSVEVDDKDFSKSKATAKIDATTIYTRDEKRDAHLKSPDFFDVQKYPTINFVSKSVKKAGANKYKVVGDLTMHGVTKEVVLDTEASSKEAKDPMGMSRRAVVATTTLNRKDYGLNWNKALEAGGFLVGDDVKVTLDLSLVKAQDSASPSGTK